MVLSKVKLVFQNLQQLGMRGPANCSCSPAPFSSLENEISNILKDNNYRNLNFILGSHTLFSFKHRREKFPSALALYFLNKHKTSPEYLETIVLAKAKGDFTAPLRF